MGGSWVVNTTGLPDGYVPPSASMSPTADADGRLAQAVDIVARHILSIDPDLGRVMRRLSTEDGDAVYARIKVRVPIPTHDEFEAAYLYLIARAEEVEP